MTWISEHALTLSVLGTLAALWAWALGTAALWAWRDRRYARLWGCSIDVARRRRLTAQRRR